MKWVAVFAVGALAGCATAHAADPGQSVTVSLTWSPGGCINVSVPNRTHVEQKLQCAGVVGVSQDTYLVIPGQWYGVDPVEAANPHHWYSCTVSMNGEEVVKQSGWAVDCLRQFA